MPYFAQGHTGFVNASATMSGGTIGNYTLEYQIDLGGGYNGTWLALNGTNLSAHVVNPAVGFKLKLRITTAVTNTTAITSIRLDTYSSASAQTAVQYPLDIITLTLTGLVSGSDIVILEAGTSNELVNADSVVSTQYGFIYETPSTVDVCVYKRGYLPFAIRNYALGTSNASLIITQIADRNYLE